ncbi:MAG: hypothetical protein ACRDBM_14800 [Sporomusa sp.]
MLGKLIKYEFKSTMKVFLTLYAATIVFALICRLFFSIPALQTSFNGTLLAIFGFIYGMVIIMTIVLTFILIIQRFYKNLLRDEGYLSHTLPVSVDAHIWGKTIPAAIWSTISIAVIILSLFLMLFTSEEIMRVFRELNFTTIWEFLEINFTGSNGLIVFLVVIWFIITLAQGIFCFYASLCIGQLADHHKLLLAVVAFFVLGIVTSIISVSFMGFSSNLFSNLFVGYGVSDSLTVTNASIVQEFLPTMIFDLVLTAIYYIITRLILSKKLNLE